LPPKEHERFVKQLAVGWNSWEDAQRQAVITKASIQPLVKMHGHATKAEIQVRTANTVWSASAWRCLDASGVTVSYARVLFVTPQQSYEDRVTAYAKMVDKLPIWKYETGYKKALEGLEEANRRYKEEVPYQLE
jgi:hypothetical protein